MRGKVALGLTTFPLYTIKSCMKLLGKILHTYGKQSVNLHVGHTPWTITFSISYFGKEI
jgi:hypothetical protein